MSHDVQQVRSFEHPGEGRKRAKSTPKGRQIDPKAAEQIALLLGDRPRRRDLLIEHLHLIQDKYHQISAAHLAALAYEMKLSFAEEFETSTFYFHFDVGKEVEPDIAPLTIRVCDSLTCAMLGAEKLLHELQNTAGPGIRVVRAPCVGRCDTAPAAEVGHHFVDHASVKSVLAAAKGGDTHAHLPDYVGYDAYVAGGGYALLKRLRSGELKKEDLLKSLDDASLRGLGGAGFPTGRKWRAVLGEPGPRLMAVNGDEGEPGTFKDRYYLETDPHRFLEGMLIGAHVVEAPEIYIYIRDEYPASREILEREIAKLPPGGPALRRCLHRRRGILPPGKHRRQTRIAAAQAAVSVPGRAVRVADADQQYRDAMVGTRHRRKRRGLVEEPRPQRPPRPAQLFGVGAGKKSRHEAGAGGCHRARIDRRVLRRHGRRAYFPRLPAGRRVRRHPAGLDGQYSARFRHAGKIRLLHRFGRGHHPVGAGQRQRRGAEPDAFLRGRKLRPVHALPRRHPKGGAADGKAGLEPRTARRIEPGNAGCLDLRPRPGGLESADLRH